eukprot:gene28520-31678_t
MRFTNTYLQHRVGREVDDFTCSWDIEEARQQLINHGHDLNEYLIEGDTTKFFFDAEKYFKSKQEANDSKESYEREVREAVEGIIRALSFDGSNITYVMATRHGYDTKRNEHKLSFRPFILGIKVNPYHRIPDIFKKIGCPLDKTMWDMTVYRLNGHLVCINGRKNPEDNRILTPIEKDGIQQLENYVVQNVEDDWICIQWDDTKHSFDYDQTIHQLGLETSDTSHYLAHEHIVSLIKCLGPVTATDRQSWLKVAIILKFIDSSSGSDTYFDAFVEFSRLGGYAFKSEEDCHKTLESIHPASALSEEKRLKVGTLCHYAKRDNPAAYSDWRLDRDLGCEREDCLTSKTQLTNADNAALLNALVQRFPDEFGSIDVATFRLNVRPRSGELDFPGVCPKRGPISGFVAKDCTVTIVGSDKQQRFLGLVFADVPVKDSMATIHTGIHPDLKFVFNRPEVDKVELKSVIPNAAMLTQYYAGADRAFLKVDIQGKD